ncbi:MAG: hypothetical protein HZB76_05985 [Chlamydiae bacterium]|nr:hypothetical protein [Chlamydiota bacterium]
MNPKDFLTNERLSSKFRNNFKLTGIAIEIAKKKIAQGQIADLSEIYEELLKMPFEDERGNFNK